MTNKYANLDGTEIIMSSYTQINTGFDRVESDVKAYAADAGATDAYAVTLSPVPTAYAAGMIVRFKANTANTGAATINVNSLGAQTIKKNVDEDLETGDILADQIIAVMYDGTNFQMLSGGGELMTHKAETAADDVHGLGFKGVLLRKTVNQTITTGVNTALDWETEDYDTDSFHDASNPSRITFANAGKVQLGANIRWGSSSTGDRQVRITKNGSFLAGFPQDRIPAATGETNHGTLTPVLTVATGDYFEVEATHTNGSSLDVLSGFQCIFHARVVE